MPSLVRRRSDNPHGSRSVKNHLMMKFDRHGWERPHGTFGPGSTEQVSQGPNVNIQSAFV